MKKFVMAGLLAAGLTAAAIAQGAPPVHIRGVVSSLDGNVLTVGAPIGTAATKVTLAPNFKVAYVIRATLASIVAGSYVGTAAIPQTDGSLRAIEVHIFPPGLTPGPGTRRGISRRRAR